MVESCEFGSDCPCQWESVGGSDLDVLFERHPEMDMRGKDVTFGEPTGLGCPEDGWCREASVPCDAVWFCVHMDGA